MPTFNVDHSTLLITILGENPPLSFTQLYEMHKERSPVALTKEGIRKHLNALLKAGVVVRSTEYIHKVGYLYSTPLVKSDPLRTPTEVTFGTQTVEGTEFLRNLIQTEEHPNFSKPHWDAFRIGLARLVTHASVASTLDLNEFRQYLERYRDFLVNHMGQVNTVLNGDLWQHNKSEAITNQLDDPVAVVETLNEYTREHNLDNKYRS